MPRPNDVPAALIWPRVSDALGRWSDEGRHLLDALGGWLEEAGHVHGQAVVLEGDRDRLIEEVRRAREDAEALRAERDELEQALQALARRMTHAADAILEALRRDPAAR